MENGKLKWKDKDDILDIILWNNNQILKNHFEENEIEIEQNWKEFNYKFRNVKEWLNNVEKEEQIVYDRLKKNVFLVLINNQDIIICRG